MNYSYYQKKVNENTTGKNDITPIFHDYAMIYHLVVDLSKPFKKAKVDKVVGIDALGFVIGAAVALELKAGFIPIRKTGKLPSKNKVTQEFVDYSHTQKSLEINQKAIKKGERILIVDDWIETGAQIRAAIKLVENQGGKVIGVSTLFAEKNNQTKELFSRYPCYAINKPKN